MMRRSMTLVLALVLALTGVITVSADVGIPEAGLSFQQDDQPAAWLGVSIVETQDGVMISQVLPDSPADEAGLRHGDFVTAVGDTSIDSAQLLVETIQGYAPGDEVELTFTRGDETQTVTITLAERPAEMPFASGFAGQGEVMVLSMMGLNLQVADGGMVVQSITPGSPFADSDLQEGDLITAVNGETVADGFTPFGIMGQFRFDKPLVFTVERDGEEIEVEVQFDEGDLNMPMFPSDSDLQIQPVPAARPTQLGVQFQTLDTGAQVVEVFEGTPAAAAGLQVDDIIQAVDGDVVDEERTLADRLYAYEEGDVVTLTVLRGGETLEIDVELGPRNDVMRFGGPFQMMPMQPGGGPFFGPGYGPGPHMGGQRRPFGGPQGGCWGMMPDGGMFPFDKDFFENHPFWGQSDGDAPDTDSGSSM